MWDELNKHLKLDPPVKLENNVYLGMRQSPCKIPQGIIDEKRKIFKELTKHTNPEMEIKENDKNIQGYQYDLIGNINDSLIKYCSLAGIKESDIPVCPTPCMDDHQLKPEEFEIEGQLKNESAKLVMGVMWPARLTRPDIMWTSNDLARNITKWTVAHDKRLLRLMGYLKGTSDYAQYAFVGDLPP